MPYHTIPYHTIPYHNTPYHTIPSTFLLLITGLYISIRRLAGTTGQSGGGRSGCGRNAANDWAAGSEERKGRREIRVLVRSTTTGAIYVGGDAHHRTPGSNGRCSPNKGCEGAGFGRLAAVIHAVAAATAAAAGRNSGAGAGSGGAIGRVGSADSGKNDAGAVDLTTGWMEVEFERTAGKRGGRPMLCVHGWFVCACLGRVFCLFWEPRAGSLQRRLGGLQVSCRRLRSQ